MKMNRLMVTLESYLYLQTKSIESRGKKADKAIPRLTRNFRNWMNKDGYYWFLEGSLGYQTASGGYGVWSIQDMKDILDNAHLPYKDGSFIECVSA